MFTKISVLVPTRKRLGRLRKMIESYERTFCGMSELVFRIDDDDEESAEFLCAQASATVLVHGGHLDGYRSMPIFFNQMVARSNGDVLLCGNDDMVFETPEWAWIVLNAANRFPDGVFNFAVRSFNEDHYPFSIVSRKAVDALGFIWDPRIYWGDIYLRDVMGTLGRAFHLPNVKIEHEWAGFTPDATFLEGKQQEIWERDPTYWAGTHAQAVGEAVVKLRELM